jgi:hypothetical protein
MRRFFKDTAAEFPDRIIHHIGDVAFPHIPEAEPQCRKTLRFLSVMQRDMLFFIKNSAAL